MNLTIENEEIFSHIGTSPLGFPTYVSPLLNLANQFAQATRPYKVGKMSELIKQFTGNKLKEWEDFYLQKYPHAIQNAAQEIRNKVEKLKKAIAQITDEQIEAWVRDLVIVKTFAGLKFQEAILKKIAQSVGIKDYRLASIEEEAKGIDGYIGNHSVSIKPKTYQGKQALPEELQADVVIYYKKTKRGIKVEFDEHQFQSS